MGFVGFLVVVGWALLIAAAWTVDGALALAVAGIGCLVVARQVA